MPFKPPNNGDPGHKPRVFARNSTTPRTAPPEEGTIDRWLTAPGRGGRGNSWGHRGAHPPSWQHPATRSHKATHSNSRDSGTSTCHGDRPKNRNSFPALRDNEAEDELDEDALFDVEMAATEETLHDFEGLSSSDDSLPNAPPFVKPKTPVPHSPF
eukprot:scaffold35698_cov63-Attheya_sp.AAC.1